MLRRKEVCEISLLKAKDFRNMRKEERTEKLKQLVDELMHERGLSAMGGAPKDPGKSRALRKQIARLLTVEREEER
ncbi:MAG: 50S ribosomal protein L29 [Methanomassiliicoccales archaeon]